MRQTLLLLAAAVFIAALPCEAKPQAKRKPAPVPAQYDPLTEWELVNGAAMEARAKLKKARKPEAIRQQIADLAVRSAIGAERALAIGDASLFDSYRRQFREQFHDTHWRLGRMARQGGGAAEYTGGVLALHGYFEPPGLEAACRHFGAALAKGYAGAKFRLSQCLEKDDAARAAALLREAAEAGFAPGQFNLGRLYAAGTGTPRDFAEARKWLEQAEQGGIASARELLNWMDKENPEKPSK